MKYIIIGGVAGGATAAARIRRIDEHAEIVLFEKGEHISYANCGLPYYIGGTIADRDKLFVQTPEAFGRRFNIKVKTLSEVTKINPISQNSDGKNCRRQRIHRKLRQAAAFARSLAGASSPARNRFGRHIHPSQCSRHGCNQKLYADA